MNAQQVFTSAIAVAGSALKQRGFQRRGSKVTRTSDEVVALIEFRRSRDSTAAYLTFVINYGVRRSPPSRGRRRRRGETLVDAVPLV